MKFEFVEKQIPFLENFWWLIAINAVLIFGGVYFISRFFKVAKDDELRLKLDRELDWEYWFTYSYIIISDLIRELPIDLRGRVFQNSIEFYKWESLSDEDDVLGTYYNDGEGGNPVIKIYIGTIILAFGTDQEVFKNELLRTFYHEFGHHLGLNEYDLDKRGLD